MTPKRPAIPKKPKRPSECGEIWSIPNALISWPYDPAPERHERYVLLLQNSAFIQAQEILLVAPITTHPLFDVWDYLLEIGKHNHCNLTKDSVICLGFVQPIRKEDLAESKGFLEAEVLKEIHNLFLAQFGELLSSAKEGNVH